MVRCLFLLSFLCCAVSGVSAEPPLPRVGILLPMSGDFAAIGVDCRNGVDLALREVGGPAPLQVVFGDTKGDPATAVGEFRKVTATDGVSAVYIFRGPLGMAVNPLSKQSRVPLLGGIGNKAFAQQNEFAFQVWPPSDVEGRFLADFMTARGYRSVSLLTAEDDWTVSVSESFRHSFKGTIAFEQSLAAKDSDFRTVISQLRKADADAVFVNLSIAQLAVVLRQLREQGVTKPVFTNFWGGKREVIQAAGAAAEGIMFSEMSLANLPKFKESILAHGGGAASGATLSSYVAMKLLLQAAAARPQTSEEFYRALLSQHEVVAADTTFAVKNRVVELPLAMREVKGGSVVTLP